MGKRIAVAPTEPKHVTSASTANSSRSTRKRKRDTAAGGHNETTGKALRLVAAAAAENFWHENDDEDSSSNDTATHPAVRNQSSKHANNSSILLNNSSARLSDSAQDTSLNESPKPVYTLLPSVVNGTILYDLMQKPWRLGRPIGKGNFGEIFLASDNITVPVTNENAKFVVKIEPHSNGPLFVEIHCLMNTAKKNSAQCKQDAVDAPKAQSFGGSAENPPSGIPDYIASGSHYFGDARYRFLVLQRFDRDLHSLIKNCRVHQKSVLALAVQIVNVLESLHDKGYCHNDIKAQNLMISKCTYFKKDKKPAATTNGSKSRRATNGSGGAAASLKSSKYDDNYEEKQQTTDSGNSSEQEANDDEDADTNILVKRQAYADDEEDEDFDDGATTNSNNSNSMDIYETPVNRNRKRRPRNAIVEYSGSNPVRSCRRQKRNSIYDEMIKSHYLRPTKRISYSEFFTEDGVSVKEGSTDSKVVSSDDESEEFLPRSIRRLAASSKKSNTFTTGSSTGARRITRRQEKLQNGPALTHKGQSSANGNGASTLAESLVPVQEERIFLIDFGLASKFMDNGIHRPFVMDQRRAHDGTLEFTSRDAHMGAHSRRSDLECLGYNLIFWSQGYLPWKDAATQHQQDKVHRAKEYLMTDVREMLKQIYGKRVPKYLGEYLHHVGQLAYHERPDYARYRRIFEREFQQLGYSLDEMHLNSHEIVRTCVRIKEEIENKNDIFEINKHNCNAWSIMKNISVGTPFHECTLSNRVSPKNLRSKSDKKSIKKKKFSWAEILSQDPDQIARERAEKEFDREEELSDVQQPTVRRYEGKPTYAILEIQQRLRQSGRLIEEKIEEHDANNDDEAESELDDEEEDDKREECDEQVQEEDDGEHSVEEDEEDDSTNDDDEEDNEAEEDVETDATEASEETVTEGSRRAHNTRSATSVVNSRRAAATAKTTSYESDRFKSDQKRTSKSRKRSTPAETKTRNSTAVTAVTVVATSKVRTQTGSNKRGGGAQSKRKTATKATARGEFKIDIQGNNTAADHHSSDHQHKTRHGQNGHGSCSKLPERRTRRCLIKTDTELDEEIVDQDGSGNCSPDVCGLFNVWKNISSESIYYRGSSTVAMATRHYKK